MAVLAAAPADRLLELVDVWLSEEAPHVDGEEHALAELIRVRAQRRAVEVVQRGALALSLSVALRKLKAQVVLSAVP